MKLINIAFDLDGCLVDIMPVVRLILKEKHGAEMLPIKKWRIYTDPFLPDNMIWECIHESYERMDDIVLLPGAHDLLYKLHCLSDGDDPVKIITARPPKTAANCTYQFISEYLCDFPYELVITSTHSKRPYLNRYKYYVDDKRTNAIELASEGIHVFMPKWDYNRLGVKDYPNVSVINGVKDLIPRAEEFIINVP